MLKSAHRLRRFLTREFHAGLYEILDYDAVLELVDPAGEAAWFRKRERVKFLQDYLSTFQDYAWGDGQFLSEYHCAPGSVVDRYLEGGRWNLLLSLRETKSCGDTEDFYIQRQIIQGFTKKEEWWQICMQHQTRHLKLAILFPKGRPCQRAVLIERNRNRTTRLEAGHLATLPDGRQILTWETDKPRRFENYTFKWHW